MKHPSSPQQKVLVLVGPTASGKTPISLLLAQSLDAEILSADSRQVYKSLDVGTAKPSVSDRAGVKHYFVDELDPSHDFNAGEFGSKGREIIRDIFLRNKVPLIVGGSGLYVQALTDGFFEGPGADEEIRRSLELRLKSEGPGNLLEELRLVDPAAASKMLPSHTRRIVRALEVYRITGTPLSELQKARVEISFTPVLVGVQWHRKILYERINHRVELMLERGLVEEAKSLKAQGYSSKFTALQTVGYKEVFEFLGGEYDYERMVFLIKRNSRRYAKRQLTWFRRDARIKWFDVSSEIDYPRIAEEMCAYFSAVR